MPYKNPKASRKLYYEKNKEQIKERSLNYYYTNCVELKEKRRRYRTANLEEVRANDRARGPERSEQRVLYHRGYNLKNRKKLNEHRRKKFVENPTLRVIHNLRGRLHGALRGVGSKSASTFSLVGCSTPELLAYLEAQFRTGMTWENYGPTWHVDHIRPCASFDLIEPLQQKACFHFSNLQPLFAKENLKKGSRF